MSDLFAFLFVFGAVCVIVLAVWKILAIICVALVLAWAITGVLKAGDTGRQRRRDREAAIIARADKQHSQIMSGDEINGTYGDYLPPKGLR